MVVMVGGVNGREVGTGALVRSWHCSPSRNCWGQCPCGQLPLLNGPSQSGCLELAGVKAPLSGTKGTRWVDMALFSLAAFS